MINEKFEEFVIECSSRRGSQTSRGNPTEYSFIRLNKNIAIAIDFVNGGVYDVHTSETVEPIIVLTRGFSPKDAE